MKLIRGPLPSWRLENQSDGRKLAVTCLRMIRDAGEKCRADQSGQSDILIRAMIELHMRGNCPAIIGFASILQDFASRHMHVMGEPEHYAALDRAGTFKHWRDRGTQKNPEGGANRDGNPGTLHAASKPSDAR